MATRMKRSLEQLQELQEINQKIEQLERDAERLNIDVRNAERTLADKRRRYEETRNQRLEARKEADRLQLELEEAEEENARLRVQLNSITNKREYDAIKKTIASHEADIERWEDKALDLLGKIDELQQEEERLEQEVTEAERHLQEVEEEVSQEKEELADRIEMLKHKRETLRREIDDDALAAYDRLTNTRRSDPLAEVKERVCQGCYTQITKQTENRLMHGSELVYCHSCGRLLMLAD